MFVLIDKRLIFLEYLFYRYIEQENFNFFSFMRILVIPDSFKECLSAERVSKSIASGIDFVDSSVDVIQFPFSDGGEGAFPVIQKHVAYKLIECVTQDAMGNPIKASYLTFNDHKTAWIELSKASGLADVPVEKRSIALASTFGTGLMVKDAIRKCCTEIILGFGGSATNDGGAGIFQALGGSLKDKTGNELNKGGSFLSELHLIIAPKNLNHIKWKVACDVDSPLLGINGATAVYGPQKGASPKDIVLLEHSLNNFCRCISQQLGRSIGVLKGGGAAGGSAAGMYGFFNANLVSGFSLLAELVDLENEIEKADLIFTAEGKIDQQSISGKLTGEVARLGKKYKVPVIGIGGSVEVPFESFIKHGFLDLFSIQTKGMSLEYSKQNASELIKNATSNLFSSFVNKLKKVK